MKHPLHNALFSWPPGRRRGRHHATTETILAIPDPKVRAFAASRYFFVRWGTKPLGSAPEELKKAMQDYDPHDPPSRKQKIEALRHLNYSPRQIKKLLDQ